MSYYDMIEERVNRRATMKARLMMVFKSLKKEYGFQFARQNFLCCQSCAGYAIGTKSDEQVKAGKKAITKWAYYHRQDTETLEKGYVYISFGDTETEGEQILAAAIAAGLAVQWDGTVRRRPRLMLTEAVEEFIAKKKENIAEYEKRIAEGTAQEPERVRQWIDMELDELNSIHTP